jgi:hypothetical protein
MDGSDTKASIWRNRDGMKQEGKCRCRKLIS